MASPFFFVKKKDGNLCPTQDYQKLNDATIKNRYPLPLISDLVDNLKNAKVFLKMDVQWGYNNIRIKEGDEWKAAFCTNLKLFKPTVMFFSLTNSPATLQNFMNHIFKPLIYCRVVAIYMDDKLVFTETHKEHKQVVKEVLDILHQNNLFLKPEKCVFHQPEVEYLGMIIGHGQVKMDHAKISAISNWPTPKTVKQEQSFLGFANFYRRFIKNFSKIALPLTTLTKKDITWNWTTDQQNSFKFDHRSPPLNPSSPYQNRQDNFELRPTAIGAILSQKQNEKWHFLTYFSKSLNETQRNYEIHGKEMLAIILALKEWTLFDRRKRTF